MTALYFILLIGVLIFVHELGHFLFAKLFDVKVLKFSLGFGPRAVGFKRGETEYCASWLPLGGYVKMLGEDPNDEIRREDQGRAFHQKPLWQRYMIVFAGPAFNIVFPTLIYLLFFGGQTHLFPAVVGKVSPDQPAAEAGLQPGDRIVAIDGRPITYWENPEAAGGGYWSVLYNISRRPGESLHFTIEREGKLFERYISPREYVRRNSLGFQERYGLIGISPLFELPQIGLRDPRSPAALAGLRTGDVITAVNDQPVQRWDELERLLERNSGQSLRVSFLRPSSAISRFAELRLLEPMRSVLDPQPIHQANGVRYQTGLESAEFFVRRVEKGSPAAQMGLAPGDRILELDGEPVTSWAMLEVGLRDRKDDSHSLTWAPYGGAPRTARFKLARIKFEDDYGTEQERYVFGASAGTLWQRPDPVALPNRATHAAVEAVRKTGQLVGVMAMAIVQLFRGEIPRDTIGGPVMLAYTARAAADKGWDHFLWIMALISINLGIINLLPIPILDGGHILFFTIEAIKRRPLSLKVREIASYVGLVMLISLMVFALKNDVVRYWVK